MNSQKCWTKVWTVRGGIGKEMWVVGGMRLKNVKEIWWFFDQGTVKSILPQRKFSLQNNTLNGNENSTGNWSGNDFDAFETEFLNSFQRCFYKNWKLI